MRKPRRVLFAVYSIGFGMGLALVSASLITSVLPPGWGFGIVPLIGGALGWIFFLPLQRMLARFQNRMEEVARGDLTVRMETSNPIREVDALIQCFDRKMVGGLQVILLGMKDILEENRGLIRAFSQAADTSQEHTQEMTERIGKLQERYMDLNNRIEEMSRIESQLHHGVQQIDGQISEQSGAIHETSASLEQMTASLWSVARIATQKQESTQTLIHTSREGEKKVSAARDAMTQMTRVIEEVQKIVELINDVADRTNLLAMNAAIEATHAGQYGKGFSVVASEIRRLAESTASHTKKVGSTLDDFIEKMGYLGEAARVAFTTIHELNTEIVTFVDAFGEIAQGTQEVASGSVQMLGGIGALRSSAESLQGASKLMREQVGELHALVGGVKAFARESFGQSEALGEEVRTVESLQEDIAKSGKESIDRINTLSTELKYFRLEKNGAGGDDSYTQSMKEIILNHKRIVFTSRAYLEGRMEKKHLPDPSEPCPLDGWIRGLKHNPALKNDVGDLERIHRELHRLYREFHDRAEHKDGELYRRMEKKWKELIIFREVLQKATLALQRGTLE